MKTFTVSFVVDDRLKEIYLENEILEQLQIVAHKIKEHQREGTVYSEDTKEIGEFSLK